MATLMGHLHFWTLARNALDKDKVHVGCHSYHSSKETPHPYYEEFKTFTNDRGQLWSPDRRGPEKIREALKEVQGLLSNSRCIFCSWHDRNRLKLMFNNGIIVIIRVKAGVGDIEKITIDKYLVGKLYSDHIVDVIFNDGFILVSYVEPKLTRILLSKKSTSLASSERASRKWEKLATLDAKISHLDLVGPVGRRLERKLSCNVRNDQILIWWACSDDEVCPWTPISTDRDRANVHVYAFSDGSELRTTCRTRTKSDPLWVSYGRLHPYQFRSIEQRTSRKGGANVDMCIYEILSNRIQRLSVTTIPIEGSVICHALSEAEDRIVLGCTDSSLVIYDTLCKTTHVVRATVVPGTISWHPSGTVFVVGSGNGGRMECYDLALCRVHLELASDRERTSEKCLDISEFLESHACTIQRLAWMPQEFAPKDVYGYCDNTHSVLILNERGPLAILVLKVGVCSGRGEFSPVELVSEYLNHGQMEEAVNLLLNLNWNVASDTCFMCVSLIVNHLLKLPLDDKSEVQLEMALKSFYSPSDSLSDVVFLEFGDRMRCLARRFFHHLLRHERFEKAFLLAADIGSQDLFMDIHYVALDKHERVLAQAALDRAHQIEAGSDSASSADSRLDETDSTSGSSRSRSRTRSSSSYSSTRSSTSCSNRSDAELQVRRATSHNQVTSNNNNPMNPSGSLAYSWHNSAVERWPKQSSMTLSHLVTGANEDTFEVDDDYDEGHHHGTVHEVHFGVV